MRNLFAILCVVSLPFVATSLSANNNAPHKHSRSTKHTPHALASSKHATAHTHASPAQSHDSHEELSTEDLIAKLKTGNANFVMGKRHSHNMIQKRSELAKGQHPYAIVLTCADSRVPPEMVFDEELGNLFVVRVAGNIVNSDVLGSIEYAAEHLHAKHLIVMGHESCGAVKAAIEGGDLPPNIAGLLNHIKPAVHRARKHSTPSNLLNVVIEDNVLHQVVRATQESTLLKELVEKHELTILGAVYELKTGRVNFLPTAETEVASLGIR